MSSKKQGNVITHFIRGKVPMNLSAVRQEWESLEKVQPLFMRSPINLPADKAGSEMTISDFVDNNSF